MNGAPGCVFIFEEIAVTDLKKGDVTVHIEKVFFPLPRSRPPRVAGRRPRVRKLVLDAAIDCYFPPVTSALSRSYAFSLRSSVRGRNQS